MVPLPEERLALERRLRDASSIFQIPPLGPALSEVNAVPQLLSSERIVSEDEIISAISKCSRCQVCGGC